MPRKQSKTGKPVNADGIELKGVRLELDLATHKALRMEAASQDKSMAALVKGLVEDFLAKRKPGSK